MKDCCEHVADTNGLEHFRELKEQALPTTMFPEVECNLCEIYILMWSVNLYAKKGHEPR
jgi:hypothetical protein